MPPLSALWKQRALIERQLLLSGFKLPQVPKHVISAVEYPVLPAYIPENLHKAVIVRALAFIAAAESPGILLLDPWKMLVELIEEMIPAALAHSRTHGKANDAAYFCPDTIVQYPAQVFLGVVYKRQDRGEPDDGRYTCVPHCLQRRETL